MSSLFNTNRIVPQVDGYPLLFSGLGFLIWLMSINLSPERTDKAKKAVHVSFKIGNFQMFIIRGSENCKATQHPYLGKAFHVLLGNPAALPPVRCCLFTFSEERADGAFIQLITQHIVITFSDIQLEK